MLRNVAVGGLGAGFALAGTVASHIDPVAATAVTTAAMARFIIPPGE
jgi:hypothetical protein